MTKTLTHKAIDALHDATDFAGWIFGLVIAIGTLTAGVIAGLLPYVAGGLLLGLAVRALIGV